MGAVVVFDQFHEIIRAAGSPKVSEGFLVDGEVTHRGTVFGGHVGDCGAVRERKFGGSGSVEFNEFSDDFVLAENLGHGEGKIGGSGGSGKFPGQIKTDDFGGQEGKGLAEHTGFRFNSAHSPANDSEAVDHGGVGIGTDERIGVGEEGSISLFLGENAAGEVFEVHLMDDADSGGDDAKGLKGLLAPFEEFVAFAVALELVLHVQHERLFRSVDVDLNGVIDDEIDGDEGFDDFGIFFEAGDSIAHGGEVDQERHAGEVLEDDAGDSERDFFSGWFLGIPAGEVLDIAGACLKAVAVAEDRLENDAERNREPG